MRHSESTCSWLMSTVAMLTLVLGGCSLAPKSAPWRNDQETILPVPPEAQGSLVVETQEAGSPQDGEQPHERYYLYDQGGRYLTYFPNDHFLPISLPVGRYVVVSRYSGKNKRVQVELREGCTTYVRLHDFKKAPDIE